MLEASVETYKRKLDNLGDLKRQMKLLEENNMTYMQNTVSLEEELRKANAARAQLETYKRQASDLHIKIIMDVFVFIKRHTYSVLREGLYTSYIVGYNFLYLLFCYFIPFYILGLTTSISVFPFLN